MAAGSFWLCYGCLLIIASLWTVDAGSKNSECKVSEYTGIIYKTDNWNQNAKSTSTSNSCSKICAAQSSTCQAYNYIKSQQVCYLMQTGVPDPTADKSANTELNEDYVYGYVDCSTKSNGRKRRSDSSTSVQCGIQAPQYEPSFGGRHRIIGGTTAKPHSWPWLLQFYVETSPGRGSNCGANLVRVNDKDESSDIVITAAHCVTTRDQTTITRRMENKMRLRAGCHNRDQNSTYEQYRTVAKYNVHPGYNAQAMSYDVAVLKLDHPIEFSDGIRPICLPAHDAPIPVDQTCAVAGWGRIDSHTSESSRLLKQLPIPVQSAEVCTNGWKQQYEEDKMICAGHLGDEATSSTCPGDSGGMLVCKSESEAPWILYGTTSFGYDQTCLSPDKPSVFARLSYYMDFINSSIHELTELKENL